ncbi:Transcriptional regulator, predicted component of viral defense system [Variovorax sp. YR266]|uniref:type IV toxin-antitoxin system AbiEi family antitoxin domain-containing protein n=1 Tax=Variovorax sp. YR266 TaxID=1884386 RepID=UPI0008998D3A|nr:hypothetical protein [Variovorax sp. YR266]SDZ70539.1 Transcriptional regulator, predicted component of viral defense system [Variovorax sp. YR266]
MPMTSTVHQDLVSSVADALALIKEPAVSSYELGKLVFSHLPRSSRPAQSRAMYEQVLTALKGVRLLTPIPTSAQETAYLLFGSTRATPDEIMCSLDPFAYVSHLSAMEYHGLTDRFSKIVYMTTPPVTAWRRQAQARMARDLDDRLEDYKSSGLPRLTRPHINNIGHTNIEFHERSQFGAFRNVAESPLRVATLGRVFLDMLREPKLCGGIQHVLDVYRKEAKRYLKLIVDETDRHGQPIDKVRAGFVITEVCRLDSPVIDEWQKFAQRGGSRKLDAENEYAPVYSERWQLSINVPSLALAASYDHSNGNA